jgi:hypothetical protein
LSSARISAIFRISSYPIIIQRITSHFIPITTHFCQITSHHITKDGLPYPGKEKPTRKTEETEEIETTQRNEAAVEVLLRPWPPPPTTFLVSPNGLRCIFSQVFSSSPPSPRSLDEPGRSTQVHVLQPLTTPVSTLCCPQPGASVKTQRRPSADQGENWRERSALLEGTKTRKWERTTFKLLSTDFSRSRRPPLNTTNATVPRYHATTLPRPIPIPIPIPLPTTHTHTLLSQ